MLEEVVVMVCPFELLTVAMETYFAESGKNCEQQSFAPVNQSSFLRLLQMVFKRKFRRCYGLWSRGSRRYGLSRRRD